MLFKFKLIKYQKTLLEIIWKKNRSIPNNWATKMNHTKPTSNTKTHRSVNNYINSLHDQYSKILAIRVDLGYLKEHSEQALLSDIKKDVKKLLDNRRGKPSIFQDQVGYVVKYENAPDKGPHAHALFLYDGQHVQKDA